MSVVCHVMTEGGMCSTLFRTVTLFKTFLWDCDRSTHKLFHGCHISTKFANPTYTERLNVHAALLLQSTVVSRPAKKNGKDRNKERPY